MTFAIRGALAAMVLVSTSIVPALASDATAIASAHSEGFGRACASGKIDAVLAFYDKDAIVVWPGQGEEAKGKAAIAKLVANLCTGKDPAPVLKAIEGRPLGPGYVATHGTWEQTTKGADGKTTTLVIRTTEVLRETHGRWRYVIDHASIGLPPPPNS
jgi:uncharacterized protein (TIGR02246 family)